MMPQTPERKRAYNKLRQRKLRGYGVIRRRRRRGEREYEGEGVVPDHNVVPDRERGNVVPWEDNKRVWSKGIPHLIEYLRAVACRGKSLVFTASGYEVVDLATGVIGFGGYLPERDTLGAIEAQETRIAVLEQRQATLSEKVEKVAAYNIQLEADLSLLHNSRLQR